MQTQIVPIQISHAEGFHAVVDTVARERAFLPRFEAPPLSDTLDFLRANIENAQTQWVAIVGTEVVGWCDILRKSDPIRQHVGVLGIGLLPRYRRQGLGQRLMATALEDSRRQAFRRIELAVRASNTSAIRLYESHGFAREGVLRNDILIDGTYDSTLFMALLRDADRPD